MASYRRNLSLVKKHLQSHESIFISIEGVYEKNDWTRKGILVATENRIIFFADKLIGFDLESFPFKNVSSYEYSKNLMGHKIKFYASGNEIKIKWINSSNISKFNNYINSNIGQQNSSKTIVQTESVASQLEKFANLLEKKLITEVEFIKMKNEITSTGGQKSISFKQESGKENILQNKPSVRKRAKKKKYKTLFNIIIAGLIVIVFVKTCKSSDTRNVNEVVRYNKHIEQYSKANLNIRKRPNTKGKVLKVIKPNDKVITYDSIVNGFVMVLNNDSKEYGWASSKYLQKSPLSKNQIINISNNKEKNLGEEKDIKFVKKSKSQGKEIKKKDEGDFNDWYVGGKLHTAKITDWKKASTQNKIATCADFIAVMDNKVSMKELKVRATELKNCINEATWGVESTNNMEVSEVAAQCMILLGYRK